MHGVSRVAWRWRWRSVAGGGAKATSGTSRNTRKTEHVSKEPFGNIPKGPLQIFISINQQKLHLYSDGIHVADALGRDRRARPADPDGRVQRHPKAGRFHHSNIYSNAPMPFMQRITWSGVALHEGENIGHPASHGCIRMPHEFAVAALQSAPGSACA